VRQFLVLPAMRFADQDLGSVGAAIEVVRQYKHALVLVTGLVDVIPSACLCKPVDRRCVPSEATLFRFQEAFLRPMFAMGRDRVGFVGLWDVLAGCCSNRTVRFESWLDSSGVTALPARYEISPEWWVFGRSRQACRSRGLVPGLTGVEVAKRFGASVIVGDTGRLGVGRLQITRDSGTTVRVGVEAGSLIVAEVGKRDRRKRSEFGVAVVAVERSGLVEARAVEL
jgi:hypothetical protein